MAAPDHIDMRNLPASAQQEVYDFYLLVRQRVLKEQPVTAAGEGALLSEEALADDWGRPEEDETWQAFQ